MLQEPRDLLERHRIDQIEHAVDILQVRLQVTLVRAAEEHERVAILVALDQRHVIADAPAPERRVRARAGINADDRLALRLQPRAQRLQLRARHESLDQFRQFRPVIGNRDAVRREDALGQLAEHRLLVEQRIVFDAQRERRALERRPETRAARRHARDQLGYAVVLVVIDREVVAARPEEPPAQIRQRAHERRRRDEDRADERQLGEQRGVGAIGRQPVNRRARERERQLPNGGKEAQRIPHRRELDDQHARRCPPERAFRMRHGPDQIRQHPVQPLVDSDLDGGLHGFSR